MPTYCYMFFFITCLLPQAVTSNGTKLPDTVHNIMNTWVLQMGFPVVTIDTTTGVISQEHFLLDPDSNVTTQSPFEYVHCLSFILPPPGTVQLNVPGGIRVQAMKELNATVCASFFLFVFIIVVLCHDSNCIELEWARNMKLGLITGNAEQLLPEKYEPNCPDGGAVIKAQQFDKNTILERPQSSHCKSVNPS